MSDSDTPNFATNEEAVDHILGVLDKAEAGEAGDGGDTEIKKTAAETPSGEEKEEEAEPETAIEPPHSWTNELKAKWKDLPEDVQRDIAQHEQARESKLGRKLEESASTSKAAEAAKQAAEQERQRFAALSEYFTSQVNTIDPIIAEAAKIDWTKLAQDNPAEYVAKRAQIEQRVQQLQTVEQERQRLATDQQRELITKGTEVLVREIPEWRDDTKREKLQKELATTAAAYGYSPEEYGNIFDHRNILVLRDLKEFKAMKAAEAALEGKKAAPAAQRMVRPGSANAPATSGQFKALKARAIASGKDDDRVAAVMAAIGD